MKVINKDSLSEELKYVLFYIEHLELIQLCINIYNDHERKPDQKKLHALKNTFAFLFSIIRFAGLSADSSGIYRLIFELFLIENQQN